MSAYRNRILIAEDAPDVARTIQFSLERAGYETKTARDGQEAWDCLEQESFDLVVLDYRMPKLSGEDVCQRMRSDPRYQATPIIVVTAKAFEVDVDRLKSDYATAAVFTKPFSPQALVQQVASLLRPDASNHN